MVSSTPNQGGGSGCQANNNGDSPQVCVNSCQAYGRVCPIAARASGILAQQQQQQYSASLDDVRRVEWSELRWIKKLGEGGYCTVHQVEINGCDYALKQLKRQVLVDPQKFREGAVDLAREASVLATLAHPHIIKLYGISTGSVQGAFARTKPNGKDGFFLLLEQLSDRTLESKIQEWKQEDRECCYGMCLYCSSWEKRFYQRLSRVVLPIAQTLEYLHENRRVILRDLKPENVGFGMISTEDLAVVKLFDFGVATSMSLNGDDDDKNGAMVGSLRYMPPEVVLGQWRLVMDHAGSVDVYSFGLLLWQLCSLQRPFDGYTPHQHRQRVVLGGERPSVVWYAWFWPEPLQALILQCWANDPQSRPTMAQVVKTLQEDILSQHEAKPKQQQQVVPLLTIPNSDSRQD